MKRLGTRAGGRGLALVVAAVVGVGTGGLTAPRAVYGNAAARQFSSRAAEAGTFLPGPTPVEVEREELVIRCDDGGGHAGDRVTVTACRFEATYFLRNPTDDLEEVTGAFYGGSGVTVAIGGGRDARIALEAFQIEEIDKAVTATAGPGLGLFLFEPPPRFASLALPQEPRFRRTGFAFRLAAGARDKLVFAGALDPTYHEDPDLYSSYTIAPNVTRHPRLGSTPHRDTLSSFRYFLSPLRTWAGARAISIEIDAPARWRIEPGPLAGAQPFATDAAAGWGRQRLRTTARGADAGTLDLAVTVPARRILHGGPFAGIGGAFGDQGGLRLRAGYEIAGPAWLLYALALETDARDRFAAAAVVQAATPSLMVIIPSLAAGFGPVIERAHGATSAGLRLEATVSFVLVSAVLQADLFLGHRSSDALRLALLGQISL